MPNAQRGDPRTFVYWLGRTVSEKRRSRTPALTLSEIAYHIPGQQGKPLDVSTLSRFERGTTWTPDPDATVAAYAALLQVEDGRDLWAEALQNWREHGGTPIAGRELTGPVRALLLAQEAAKRTEPYAAESPSKPTSSRTRRSTR